MPGISRMNITGGQPVVKSTEFNSLNPCWVKMKQLGTTSVWEIRMCNNQTLGAFSAQITWMEDIKSGSASLYREFSFVDDVSVDPDNYHDFDTFKQAAWDAITGQMLRDLQSAQTYMAQVMQSYPM